jgi:hypothetical protein
VNRWWERRCCAGLDEAEYEAIANLETTYDIRFEDPAHREEFIVQLLEVYASAIGDVEEPPTPTDPNKGMSCGCGV